MAPPADSAPEGSERVYRGAIDPGELPEGVTFRSGKVRDICELPDRLLLTTTDRISAFDRVLGAVPFKGEVLTELSVFWFRRTADIVANHLLHQVSPRSLLVSRCEPLPVEVVVRGYLTGSAWRDYQAGRPVSGHALPPGMRFNERFPEPLLTPSTKAEAGLHDAPLSPAEVVERGLVERDTWQQVSRAAQELFARGSKLCAERGLILVDTKYEFGLLNGQLTLIDEMHTPDSSRFWYADTYPELFQAGEKQRKLDKEYLRQWLAEQGYASDGEPPDVPGEIFNEVSRRYIRAFEEITGHQFPYESASGEVERQNILSVLYRESARMRRQ
jgi:phosphoribosylaminoimidazole-succinocarboxamide synthase